MGMGHSCFIWKHLSVSLHKFPSQGEESTPIHRRSYRDCMSPLPQAGFVAKKGSPSERSYCEQQAQPCQGGKSAVHSGIHHPEAQQMRKQWEVEDGKGWMGAEATPRQLWCHKNVAAMQCGNRSLEHLINWEAAVVISEITWKKIKIQHYIQQLSRLLEQSMG